MIALLLKNWKVVALGILILSVSGLAMAVNHYRNQYQLEKRDKQNAIKLSGLNRQAMETYRNKNDQLVTRLSALEFTTSTVKDLVKSGELGWLNQFQGLKKSMKNLETAYNIQMEASDSLQTKLDKFQSFYINSTGDTIVFQGMKFAYQDEYTILSAQQVSLDSVRVKYSVKVPVSGALFWDRKWFLGKKHYKAEITSENPHVTIPEAVIFSAANKLKK